jgi:hypothetical protein
MTKSGRPPGPIRKYTVEFVWPSDHRTRKGMESPWREAVRGVDEQTARKSATALRDMKCQFRVRMAFVKPGNEQRVIGECTASEWSRIGQVTYRHEGDMTDLIPGWVTGAESLEIPKKQKEDDCELATSGS